MKNFLVTARFLFSVIKMWLKFPKVNRILKNNGEDAAYDAALSVAKKHIEETIKITNMNVSISGVENIPDEPVVFIGNHQSYVDIYMTLKALDRRVILIGKKELSTVPIIGKLAFYLQVLYLDRNNPRKDLVTIREAINILKEKDYDILIYPEGTRSQNKKMGEFLKGSFRISQKTNAPIVPLVVNNSYKVFEENKSIKENINVQFKILEPIYFGNLSKEEQKNISNIVRNKIQNELDELNK